MKAMADVYSTVLDEEPVALTPADAAQRWFNTLITQLELDGFGSLARDPAIPVPNAAHLFFSTRR